jgi:hypothetical protein
MQLAGRADQLADEAEAAVRDLRVSIEQQVAAELRSAGVGQQEPRPRIVVSPTVVIAVIAFLLLGVIPLVDLLTR